MNLDFDPLGCIDRDRVPSAAAIRRKLNRALALADRLRVLLVLAELLEIPLATVDDRPRPAGRPRKKVPA